MIQEIIVYVFISRASSASKSTIFTHYINVTERHQKTKMSGFLTGSILSLWLSQTTPYYQRLADEMDGWNYYWRVDFWPFTCMLLLPYILSHNLLPASCLIAAWTPLVPLSCSFSFSSCFCRRKIPCPLLPVIFTVTLPLSFSSLPPSKLHSLFSSLALAKWTLSLTVDRALS